MYPNLEAELSRKKITGKDLKETLQVAESTVSLKRTGKLKFTLSECKTIRDKHFPGLKLDYLYMTDNEIKKETNE